jgi:RNA polymerase sigma-70 factor, ECF subfamily
MAGAVVLDVGDPDVGCAARRLVVQPWSPAEVGALTFDEVYREHAARVYRFCLSQLRNPTEAEDVAAEVFVSALAAYDRTRPSPEDVQPWLLRIARNEIIDRERHRRRWSTLFGKFFADQGETDHGVNVEAEVVIRDELRHVLAVMERLSPRDRELVGLRLAADLPFAEIGRVTGMTEHAATVATRRALQRLRDHLGGRS